MNANDKTRLDRFGRVLIPKPLRDALGLQAGDELAVEVIDGALWIRPAIDAGSFEVCEGVVVYGGRRAGDLEGAVDAAREGRLRGLGIETPTGAGRR